MSSLETPTLIGIAVGGLLSCVCLTFCAFYICQNGCPCRSSADRNAKVRNMGNGFERPGSGQFLSNAPDPAILDPQYSYKDRSTSRYRPNTTVSSKNESVSQISGSLAQGLDYYKGIDADSLISRGDKAKHFTAVTLPEPDDLPNDVSVLSKSTMRSNAAKVVSKVAISNTREKRRKRGLSYGRLDPEAQERLKSVRIQAEEMNLLPFKVGGPPPEVQQSEEVDDAEDKRKTEPLKDRIQRIAQKAGGGVYNTGNSTAALGNDIIKGFQERKVRAKTKKLPTDKDGNLVSLKDLEMGMMSSGGVIDSVKHKKAVVKPKPGQTKLGAFLDNGYVDPDV